MLNSLLSKLQNDYPNFVFKSGTKFVFRPPKTILFNLDDPNFAQLILHELGHATLGHRTFTTDLERLKMECAAWEQARVLAKTYNISLSEDIIEQELDTYRNWLHHKSACKKCGLTRYQTRDGRYHCPHCDAFN